jgi:phosphoglycerate dehydrogenase-like enzyme
MSTEGEGASQTLLAYAPAWERVCGRVATPLGSPILLERDGVIRRQGLPVDPASVRIDIGWASPDLFMDGFANPLLDFALAAPGLRWMQSGSAGIDNPRFPRLLAKGVRVTTNHAQAVSIADYVLAGVLDHYQRGPERRAAQRDAAWRQLPFREIAGTEWLVIGFGAIGKAVAQRARAFGARVTGVRRTMAERIGADEVVPPEALPMLLPKADIVVLTLPLGVETRDYADADFFARLKPGCVFVNVARGLLVDEAALLAALDRGMVGHAVLDVCRAEPLPDDSPLWRHPKIALTGHLAGMGSGLLARSDLLFLENLGRFLSDRPLLHEARPEGDCRADG